MPDLDGNTNLSAIKLKQEIVEETLSIMFQCEFHVLVEYIECVIPLTYTLYMGVLFHLRSAEYYPDTAAMAQHHLQVIVGKILLYSWLEVLSFILRHLAIKRKFGFSPAYVLAFVLENQFFEFQGRLVVFYVYVLELTLYHFGAFPITGSQATAFIGIFIVLFVALNRSRLYAPFRMAAPKEDPNEEAFG